ncbi:MAG: FeoA family protein [Myxococcota bacterium]
MQTVATLPVGARATLCALHLPEKEAAWLRAVGLFEGIEVSVLRHAPLGGPLHLRTSTGAELAIERSLAAAVEVKSS